MRQREIDRERTHTHKQHGARALFPYVTLCSFSAAVSLALGRANRATTTARGETAVLVGVEWTQTHKALACLFVFVGYARRALIYDFVQSVTPRVPTYLFSVTAVLCAVSEYDL